MVREKRTWHPNFIKYMEYIVNHPNYSGIPEPYKEDGSIRWVVSGNSKIGIERAKWWDNKKKDLNLSSRAEVARTIHPKELNGYKPCQICGERLSIYYVYPAKATLQKINNLSNTNFKPYKNTILEIFNKIRIKNNKDVYPIFRKIFKIPADIPNDDKIIPKYVLENCKTQLSPGVMSNAPDRFDGFHTYNACCRSKEDTGRHASNLSRYSQDRRAYENWAEGDWNLSNRIMGEFNRFKTRVKCPLCGKIRKMTADHIGPISLGFTHRPKFNPLCRECNSRKNNRLTMFDVNTLLYDERNGEQVVSWHSKYIWDKLKTKIKSDKDALNLSKAMRLNLHNILYLLYIIKKNGFEKFLVKILKPEYSFVDYKFKKFHPLRLDELEIIKKPLDSKNKQKNAERYIRISLESLDIYKEKNNRRVEHLNNTKINNEIDIIIKLLKDGREKEAYSKILEVIKLLSDAAIYKFF